MEEEKQEMGRGRGEEGIWLSEGKNNIRAKKFRAGEENYVLEEPSRGAEREEISIQTKRDKSRMVPEEMNWALWNSVRHK